MTVPILNTANSEDLVAGGLPQVQELGEASTGNLGTLQRSDGASGNTRSFTHNYGGSVEAGFG